MICTLHHILTRLIKSRRMGDL